MTLTRSNAIAMLVQIGLCAPMKRIVQALDLHPRGIPIKVWQFDDLALALLVRGLPYALGWKRLVALF